MRHFNKNRLAYRLLNPVLLATIAMSLPAPMIFAQGESSALPDASKRSLLWLIIESGVVGLVLALLSVAAVSLFVNTLMMLQKDKLIPEIMREQINLLAQERRFAELYNLCKTNESLVAQVIAAGIQDANLGIDAIREGMARVGQERFSRIQLRINYIGLVAAIAPMLGLLGTVIGMIRSFNVLGISEGAAQPAELAVGISQAMVTTGMGLVLALPMMILYSILKNKLTTRSQELGSLCERLLRQLQHTLAPAPTPAPAAQQPAQQPVQRPVAAPRSAQQAAPPHLTSPQVQPASNPLADPIPGGYTPPTA